MTSHFFLLRHLPLALFSAAAGTLTVTLILTILAQACGGSCRESIVKKSFGTSSLSSANVGFDLKTAQMYDRVYESDVDIVAIRLLPGMVNIYMV